VLHIRTMRPDDIPLGLELCRFAGWNQVEADWLRLQALSPGGVFVAEQDGRACGTASTIAYGSRIAWIGMVLVHPDYRRQGVGSALMARCVEHLQARGVEGIKLDATDQGRPVYQRLGFHDERAIRRCVGRSRVPEAVARWRGGEVVACAQHQLTHRRRVRRGVSPPHHLTTPPTAAASDAAYHHPVCGIAPKHWPAVADMDRLAFGADRLALLERLGREGASALVEEAGEIRAYGLARAGRQAWHLGPVVAAGPEVARQVVMDLLAALPDGEVCWDLMPDNAAAAELAESLGFTVARRLTRMHRGALQPGEVEMTYAAAGLELG